MIRHFRHAATGYLILGCALAGTRLLMFTATGERKRPTLLRRLRDLLWRPFTWAVAALLSRDLTPDDNSDDDWRSHRDRGKR